MMEKFEDNIRLKDVNVKASDMKVRVKDEENNEVKSEEMVPDWIWGGENNFSVKDFLTIDFLSLSLGEDPANVSMPVKELVFTKEKTVKTIKYQLQYNLKTIFISNLKNIDALITFVKVRRIYSLGRMISRLFTKVI